MAAVLLCGCQRASEPGVGGLGESNRSAGGFESQVDDQKAIDLTIADRSEFDGELAKHRGHAVLVDFWATWCGPCLEQLPHTTALARERRGDGLVVLTVCMDDPDAATRIKQMLAARGADATINFVSRIGGGSKGMEAFEIEGGAVPQYKLYDRDGKLWRTIALDPAAEKQFTAADVAAAVDELLAN
jgi:thiol-disulfide isomerase/thioredoxin